MYIKSKKGSKEVGRKTEREMDEHKYRVWGAGLTQETFRHTCLTMFTSKYTVAAAKYKTYA